MTERYQRWQRLGATDIAALLSNGRVFTGPGFCVSLKGNALGAPRLGLIVPKRVLPRAVDRNRAKRVLRECFRRRQVVLGGRDILIRVTGKRFFVTDIADTLTRAS